MTAREASLNVSQTLQQACSLHQQGRFEEAEALYQRILQVAPNNPDALYLMGTLHFQRRNLTSAISLLQRSLESRPQNTDALNNLGLAHHAKGELSQAQACFEALLRHKPDDWQALFNLGNVFREQNQLDLAANCYGKLIDRMPGFAPAFNNMALVYRAKGDLETALEYCEGGLACDPHLALAHNTRGSILVDLGRTFEATASFEDAVRLVPNFAEAHFNLGSLLLSSGEYAQAAEHLAKVVELRPQHAHAFHFLGLALHNLGADEQAVSCYRRALQLRPQWADAATNLGTSLSRLDHWDEAVDHYRRAIEWRPDHGLAWKNLAAALEQRCRFAEATQAYRQASSLDPADVLLALRAEGVCDLVFEDEDQIEEYRSALQKKLQDCADRKIQTDFSTLLASGVRPSFNLQFHGYHELPLRRAYARVFEHCFEEQTLPLQNPRPKIGFVVTSGHHYAFCRSIGGMFALFTDAIEPVIVCSPADAQRIQTMLGNSNLHFHLLPNEAHLAADSIRSGRFDVLYYFEVGTGALNYFLPFCRLAPIQCTSWGIQVTSGIPQLDYYISSRRMETEQGQARYSEKLLLLDTMLSWQSPAPRPAAVRERSRFGLSTDRTVYLCAQHLGKFHPVFDETLADILRADPRGEIVVTDGRLPWVAQRLHDRFRRRMGTLADRIRFVPQQSGDDYYSLLIQADVLLDPHPFGGVNTTYDGLSFGKAIVTLPSDDHRGRYTRGCYETLGVMDCIATTRQAYVQKAVEIANNADLQRSLAERILQAHPLLYRCERSAHELEDLFVKLAASYHD